MKCSIFKGTLMSSPTPYLEVEGEQLLTASLSIKGKSYVLIGYETSFTEAVGARVQVTGYINTLRQKGKLQTCYKVLQMEKLNNGEDDDSALEVEGILAKRDQKLTIVTERGLELIAGVIQFKDAEDNYNLVHFICKGKQARKMVTLEKDVKLKLTGVFKKRTSVYELNVKEIELL